MISDYFMPNDAGPDRLRVDLPSSRQIGLVPFSTQMKIAHARRIGLDDCEICVGGLG